MTYFYQYIFFFTANTNLAEVAITLFSLLHYIVKSYYRTLVYVLLSLCPHLPHSHLTSPPPSQRSGDADRAVVSGPPSAAARLRRHPHSSEPQRHLPDADRQPGWLPADQTETGRRQAGRGGHHSLGAAGAHAAADENQRLGEVGVAEGAVEEGVGGGLGRDCYTANVRFHRYMSKIKGVSIAVIFFCEKKFDGKLKFLVRFSRFDRRIIHKSPHRYAFLFCKCR